MKQRWSDEEVARLRPIFTEPLPEGKTRRAVLLETFPHREPQSGYEKASSLGIYPRTGKQAGSRMEKTAERQAREKERLQKRHAREAAELGAEPPAPAAPPRPPTSTVPVEKRVPAFMLDLFRRWGTVG